MGLPVGRGVLGFLMGCGIFMLHLRDGGGVGPSGADICTMVGDGADARGGAPEPLEGCLKKFLKNP